MSRSQVAAYSGGETRSSEVHTNTASTEDFQRIRLYDMVSYDVQQQALAGSHHRSEGIGKEMLSI